VNAQPAGPSIASFAWLDGAPLQDVSRLWEPDVPARLTGQYAFHLKRGGEHLLIRDALGVNKLFFAIDAHGAVWSSSFLIDLVRAGHALDDISSVPSGHRVRITPRERTLTLDKVSALSFGDDAAPLELDALAARIRARLDETFTRVAHAVAGRPLYVTLSGGLDSTAVATLARAHIGPFVGVTFCVGDAARSRVEGADLHYAQKVADGLGIALEVVPVPREELPAFVDDVLIYGQDWRDFNVHCGVVNAAIGRAIAKRHASGPRPVVLTGDTMNELMADYSPVQYRGREYYTLPRLPVGRLRRFLVGGLDAGDREVGVFHRAGLDTIQPYAWCADAYAAVPGAFLAQPGAKQRLVEAVLGDRVPRFIYDRPKVRAQVGSSAEVGGTLACLVDQGVDTAQLTARFAELFGVQPAALTSLIRAGYYRFASSYPGATDE
jgi:asparagine synthetase B (glutamine-hydrolysing)